MDLMMGVGSWFMDNGVMLIEIIGCFAVLARFTPNTTDDKIVQMILDGVNFMGMNHGKAKNQ